MDIEGKTIWQQAAGDGKRDYVQVCVNLGVILNGPGNDGCWPGCVESLRASGWSKKKINNLRLFCEEMAPGDIVVLRLGTKSVYAVGKIDGDYDWREEFGDVDGWDIQHVRRVKWLWQGVSKPKTFEAHTLKMGDTTQRLTSQRVKDWLAGLEPNIGGEGALPDLPQPGYETDLDEISEYLFDEGVASDSISSLRSQVDEFVRIAKWYDRYQTPPSEHETVSYLVVPLLRALGWTPQKMAIEWRKIDVALFSELPREERSLSVVVEAKKKGASCLSAVQQASDYAMLSQNCTRVIVTDGLRYGVFTRDARGEDFRLHSYLNLARLREKYPIYDCKGSREALLAMAPEWRFQE